MEKSRNVKLDKYTKKKCGNKYINRTNTKYGNRNHRKQKKISNFFMFLMTVLFLTLYIFAFVRATSISVPKFQNQAKESNAEKIEVMDEAVEETLENMQETEKVGVLEHIEELEIVTARRERESCIIRCETAAGIQEIPLEDFLVLALGASIDMEYGLETLKAQVVLLRGNCVRAIEKQEYSSNEKKEVVNPIENKNVDENLNKNINESEQVRDNRNGTVSDNSLAERKNKKIVGADQLDFNYHSLEDLKIIWGNKYEVYYKKAKEAVKQTKGIYAKTGTETLKGNFHAMSGGKTRSGEEILGKSYAYLQSVPCDKNLEAKNFFQTKHFEKSETSKLEILERDSAGYVTQVSWNDKIYSGEQIRQALGLASANFEIKNGEHTCITTKGIGHGFGFDQYYANYMAREMQLDYMQLIKYFYKDITFSII